MTASSNNTIRSASFGGTEVLKAYHSLVQEHPASRDRTVGYIAQFALNEAMMGAGMTAQDIDRTVALDTLFKAIYEQTVTGLENDEVG